MANQEQSFGYGDQYETIRRDAEQDIAEELGPDALADLNVQNLDQQVAPMQEVDLDPAVLDTFAADPIDDNYDTSDDGVIDEDDAGEVIDDRPQEYTQSYGTGLQGQPGDRTGSFSRRSDHHFFNTPDPTLTAGDIDANYEQAAVVGDEAIGGTAPTPDQDIVDEIAIAAGVELDDRSYLRVHDMVSERDDRRWELDPTSAEDYDDRQG